MQVGLFHDLRNPPEWERPWPGFYERVLQRCADAEMQGADAFWFTEHHFMEDGYLPQPLTFAAAVAARTNRARVGTAVVLAALRDPVHIVEEAAVVDLVSGGRLELGFGAGYREVEYAAFGADMRQRMALTDAAVRDVRDLLASGRVTPAPVQRPIPIWLGYQGPRGARAAGRLGVGLLSLRPELLEPYREGLVEGGHDPGAARMGGVIDLIVADDPDAAVERLLPHLAYQQESYRSSHAPDGSGTPITADSLRARLRERGSLPGFAVLTPDDAIARVLQRTADLPVEHVYFWASIAGMPDDLADRHVELLLSRVAPAVR
ncbi:MAG: luxA [Actinomycetia bacterium]|nr:luxA [Actinomycetes bacterium]